MDDPLKIISDLTRTDDKKRRGLLTWLAKEAPATQIEAVGLMVKNYHQLKNQFPRLNQAALYYLGLITALVNMRAVEKSPTRKGTGHDLAPLAGRTRIQVERVRALGKTRSSPKRKKLVSLWGLVRQLKNDEHLSFRDIATFLGKNKKFKINYTYIERIWAELEPKI